MEYEQARAVAFAAQAAARLQREAAGGEARALDAFRAFNFERIYLRPEAVAQADRVIELLRALVEWFAVHPVEGAAAGSDEAVAAANGTPYGLVAYAWTRDLARTMRLQESLEAGMIGINTGLVSNPAAPFGGVKSSGFGREGGFEGIEEYVDTTYVALPAG